MCGGGSASFPGEQTGAGLEDQIHSHCDAAAEDANASKWFNIWTASPSAIVRFH